MFDAIQRFARDTIRAFVLKYLHDHGRATFGEIVDAASKVYFDPYRPVDRALQHHRKAGLIDFDGKKWRPTATPRRR
jgi:hypothetical protein